MELSTYKTRGYFLEDGELLNKENPDSFGIPSLEARSSLKSGAIVKLIFNMLECDTDEETSVERMWVVVNSLDNELYIGTLDNDPYSNVTLKYGDTVFFGPQHIINIYEE